MYIYIHLCVWFCVCMLAWTDCLVNVHYITEYMSDKLHISFAIQRKLLIPYISLFLFKLVMSKILYHLHNTNP